MLSSPNGPFQNEGELWGPSEGEPHDEATYFGNGGDERNFARQAAINGFGLLSFGLPNAERRKSALSFVRKAAGAMTSVIWRCQPCQDRASQWSRPRSSFARWKHSSIVQR